MERKGIGRKSDAIKETKGNMKKEARGEWGKERILEGQKKHKRGDTC